jgi:hypothetical protein
MSTETETHRGKQLCCELICRPNLVNIIGVAAIDQNVLCLKMRYKLGNGLVHDCRRDHQPIARGFLSFVSRSCGEALPSAFS